MNKVVVCKPVDRITITEEVEFLLYDEGTVRIFGSHEVGKEFLRTHGITDEKMEHMMFLENCGICKRCGSPLFPSLLTKQGYKYQCFICDEDFYSFEQ